MQVARQRDVENGDTEDRGNLGADHHPGVRCEQPERDHQRAEPGDQYRAAAAQPVGERATTPGAGVHQRATGAVPEHGQRQPEVPELVELDEQAHDHAVGHQGQHDPAHPALGRTAHYPAQMRRQVQPRRGAVQAWLAEPGQGDKRTAGERDREEVLDPQAEVVRDDGAEQRAGDERRGLEHLHPAVAALKALGRTRFLEHHVIDGRVVGPGVRGVEQAPDRDPGSVQGQAVAEAADHGTADQRAGGDVEHALAAPPVGEQAKRDVGRHHDHDVDERGDRDEVVVQAHGPHEQLLDRIPEHEAVDERGRVEGPQALAGRLHHWCVLDEHHDTSVRRPACTDVDTNLAPQVRCGTGGLNRAASGIARWPVKRARGQEVRRSAAGSMVSMRTRADSASGTPRRSKMSRACRKRIRAASGRRVLSVASAIPSRILASS